MSIFGQLLLSGGRNSSCNIPECHVFLHLLCLWYSRDIVAHYTVWQSGLKVKPTIHQAANKAQIELYFNLCTKQGRLMYFKEEMRPTLWHVQAEREEQLHLVKLNSSFFWSFISFMLLAAFKNAAANAPASVVFSCLHAPNRSKVPVSISNPPVFVRFQA